MKKYDVIIIGGSAAGIVAATTGKCCYKDKSFLMIRKDRDALVPCGIPYVFGVLGTTQKNIIPLEAITKSGVEFLNDEVVKIDRESKIVVTKQGEQFQYEKLILATGSKPFVPNIKGKELKNTFVVPKNKEYLDKMIEELKSLDKIVVIGAGFIGVEVSEQLAKVGKNVTIVEILPHILGKAFDSEIAKIAQEELEKLGIRVYTNTKVVEIKGDEKVREVLLDNGELLESDAVIFATGYVPNTELAKEAGLELNKYNAIRVDSYMRTSDPDIFAIGDCAQKVDFITRKSVPVMLASTATSEARIAAMNLYKLSTVRSFLGTIAIFSTKIGNRVFASAGLTEEEAKKNNFDIKVGYFEGVDKHPGSLPNTNKQIVKLIVSKESDIIIGGEVVGGDSAGELINVIGMEIQNSVTITELFISQIGTHPLLTSAPTAYPLIKAAEKVFMSK
ncbi:pyridine nucleotide-disulfide oxidoreductase [Thermosipho melanesiensis]|uniref:FAD-dependent pyridine nucleotide-disulphide oxidoreductase n=2 Tax=Thermosipho melanesiensis TaxID=46541 RepID=A6LMD1_THEM4|nr:FAD-dependent oxidoreductase [Thermosipho melanesiensis]ABR31082.1 FAD-dependent pyridine nucleotide-disulphide oxidoreductase [Thermosipho melanesiensis BI429]APT74177.1 pyridine nucleotide-disulfide oxidoreductase [Thermosipho melanesiensis]OOC36121.1 pyridine nucleotide-disulfide oxidoreductase [Thermosipho melanesiensis]OOC36938.1 pyridine nucleotide-disulfide oxidoreductase [Thermosipho melanesiensis]OOC37690.1 pyridine nucleotide-disulfide oxidoreductase [Thermosipho melanesiensis]